MKRILVNATHKEEQRIAVLQDSWLFDVDIETSANAEIKSNLYLGTVTRLEPSLNAAFVDYGSERNGFLPFKEIHPSFASGDKPIKEGKQVLVQVEKSERGAKGAALTTYIAIAGRYMVFMPNSNKAGGISRRIEDEERQQMREILNELPLEPGSGAIIRTAGVGRSKTEILADLDYLQGLWKKILAASNLHKAPTLIYSDNNLISRLVRDYLQDDIDEIIIDNKDLYKEALAFIRQLSPDKRKNIVFYDDESQPLFIRFKVEEQIETIFQREVTLPSGGAIIIDQTEALVSVDVNSSRSNRGSDIEETALHTNTEAAQEIARQLRLRDLGGLVVIDFIDMMPQKNIREIERCLKQAMQQDRARVQIGNISRFGLLELSRQRLRSSLIETSTMTCPRCHGNGVIRTTESFALSILRLIEQIANKDQTLQVQARLPLTVATFLLNEKRAEFNQIEKFAKTSILLLPSNDMSIPSYEITRVTVDSKTQTIDSHNGSNLEDLGLGHKAHKAVTHQIPPVVNPFVTKQSNFLERLRRVFIRREAVTGSSSIAQPTESYQPIHKAQKPKTRNPYRGGRGRSANNRNRNRNRQVNNKAA